MRPPKPVIFLVALLVVHLGWTGLAQETETAEPTMIVAVGDSIMYGGTNWSVQGHSNTIFGGWVTLLRQQLEDQFPGRYFVINKGVDADTARGVLERLDQNVVAFDPDIVLLGIGGNDAYGLDVVATPSPTTAEYRAVMEEILATLQQELPEATIVLVGYATPVKEYFAMSEHGWIFDGHSQEMLEANFAAYNEELQEIAEQSDLMFIDVASWWPTDLDARWELLADGLHPNDAGHALIADHVYETLIETVLVSAGD